MAKDTQNSETLVELVLEENGEQYHLQVSPADSSRAARDMRFATELLTQHKAAVDQQAINAIAEGNENLVELVLQDNGEQYYLQVSQEDSSRAARDMRFATELLIQHKAAVDQQAVNAIAEGNENLVELVLQDNGEQYYLQVSQEDSSRAARDMRFATELLIQHKAAVDQQAVNAIAEGNENLVELVLQDNGEQYYLQVSQEDSSRAARDMRFATELLIQHKAAVDQQAVNAIAEGNENLVELVLQDNGEQYYLQVSQEDSSRAARDMRFATELLIQHKAAVDQQAVNAIVAAGTADESMPGCSNVVSLSIWDDATNTLHDIEVTPAQYDRAIIDLEFAKNLLKEKTSNLIATGAIASGSESLTPTELELRVVQSTGDITNEDETEELPNKNANKKARKTKNGEEYCSWTESQTKLLLSLYKDHQTKLDDGSMRHRVFWTLIVQGLKEKGHAFTTGQCSTKMDTLKRAYKKVKDHNAQTGNDKKTCEYFDTLDEMFSKKPWIRPLSQAGSNLPIDDFDENEKDKPKKRRINSEKQEKLEFMRQTLENQRLRAEATAEYRRQKLTILKDLTSKFNL